jgi:hypothetical protein
LNKKPTSNRWKKTSARRARRSPPPGKRRGNAGKPDKTKRIPVNPRVILEKLSSLPIQTWNYKADDPRTRHIGPMAQDFTAAFGVGDHHGIHLTDALGVAYASIQALHEMIGKRGATISALRRELQKINAEIRRLRSRR